MDNILVARQGMTFQRIADGEILGEKLTLGVYDSASNYREIVKPEEPEVVE